MAYTLRLAVGSSDAVIPLQQTADLPSQGGVVQIGSEQISFSHVSDSALTIVTRGYNSTTAAAHAEGASVTLLSSNAPVANIEDGSISTAKLAALAVTNSKTNDVAASKITGTISTAQIANGAVTNAKVNDVAASKITGTLATSQITNGAVTDAKINDVAASKITGTLGTSQIANGAVTDAKIAGMSSSKLSGALPAIDGSALLNIPSPWADLKSFGAAGDGVTEDTGAFQTAIASLANGGHLYIPAGVYILGASITFPADITIVGVAPGATPSATGGSSGTVIRLKSSFGFLSPFNGTTHCAIDLTAGANVTLKDIILEATSPVTTAGGPAAFIATQGNTRFDNVTIRGMKSTGADKMWGLAVMGNSDWITANNLKIYDCDGGMEIVGDNSTSGSPTYRFTDCYFGLSTSAALRNLYINSIEKGEMSFSGCTFDVQNSAQTDPVYIDTQCSMPLNFTGCSFSGAADQYAASFNGGYPTSCSGCGFFITAVSTKAAVYIGPNGFVTMLACSVDPRSNAPKSIKSDGVLTAIGCAAAAASADDVTGGGTVVSLTQDQTGPLLLQSSLGNPPQTTKLNAVNAPSYSLTNHSDSRSLDETGATLVQLAHVVGTLVNDLKALGVLA